MTGCSPNSSEEPLSKKAYSNNMVHYSNSVILIGGVQANMFYHRVKTAKIYLINDQGAQLDYEISFDQRGQVENRTVYRRSGLWLIQQHGFSEVVKNSSIFL